MEVEEELEVKRVQLLSYDQEDIYNMDETALFWKATLSTTLAMEQLSGGKVEKARITANFCCNATGTHKLLHMVHWDGQKSACFWFTGCSRL